MELKEGMYVRTKKYGIAKVIGSVNDNRFNIDIFKKDGITLRYQKVKDIVGEPSFNLIDLIEVGDYVNGYRVYSGGKKHFDYILTWDDEENYYMKISLLSVDIKSIVTKEQFSKESYKIGK